MLYSNYLSHPIDGNNENNNKFLKYKNIIFDKNTNKVISITHKRISNNDQIQLTNMELQQKNN